MFYYAYYMSTRMVYIQEDVECGRCSGVARVEVRARGASYPGGVYVRGRGPAA